MTRMIERWFPCKEVSENSIAGWGSGNAEIGVFTWFAKRPTAQAKAAVICSLLPWPEDETEQKRLQDLVKEAMTGRYAVRDELRAEILKANPDGASMLDPFSGRGMIPLEAARLGLESHAVELSPVAVLASHLLTDYPFRDWRNEPELPFSPVAPDGDGQLDFGSETAADRYYRDVGSVLEEVGRRHTQSMREFYPQVDGKQPWGYLWAVTLPCQECGRRFPLVGSYNLRMPSHKKATKKRAAFDDPGQSYYIQADVETGEFHAVVHDGPPRRAPILARPAGQHRNSGKGKPATCPFCAHVHDREVCQRLAGEGHGLDALLVVADHDDAVGKHYRRPTDAEFRGADAAASAVASEAHVSPVLTAIPDEEIPPIGSRIAASIYGAKTYGDLMVPRQTLSFVRLARTIDALAADLREAGLSDDYVRALSANAAAQVGRKIRRSTRGANLETGPQKIHDIFTNESTITFSYDNFEAGTGTGPGTWDSMLKSGVSTLRNVLESIDGRPTHVFAGSATAVPLPDRSVTAVVTDPPYDNMIFYSDMSDLMYTWLKRALHSTWPELALTPDPRGLQDKTNEIIVMDRNQDPGEHRTREHYDTLISQAFTETRRVVRDDGVVTIVFGHGDPKVWQRLLGAISGAGLVLTGSWPANTEAGGQQGQANIKTTLTMACRPAAPNRPEGMKAQVEAEVRAEVASRVDFWERSGLAPTDMLMASAGPAMEVVGRYSQVVDVYGDPVNPGEFLVVARRAVRESAHIEIDHHPLDTFDARTRFALWWVRLFGKDEAAKSELRWQTLADELDMAAVRDLVPDTSKGVRFTAASKTDLEITPESPVIDVALAMSKAWTDGAAGAGQVLAAADKESDPYLWAAVTFLADRLPDSDPDAIAFTGIVRAKGAVTGAARGVHVAVEQQRLADAQPTLDFSDEE